MNFFLESAFFDSAWKRDRFCGHLKAGDGAVTLNGWVRSLREHKEALFADLWDDSGLVQLVFPVAVTPFAESRFAESRSAESVVARGRSAAGRFAEQRFTKKSPEGAAARRGAGGTDRKIRNEDVIAVRAHVRERPKGMKNPRLPTGEIEAEVKEWRLLSPSETAPFHAGAKINEDMGLKYRYLDLRFRDDLRKNLKIRSQVLKITRDYFLKQNFYETETPVLYKSSPEGARDYIVPSRLQKGCFYALPQSPQMLKQLLMTAGMERYFQICRCFRDEDLRADRQPEFTQIDMEMSFADEGDVQKTAEGLIKQIWKEVLGEDIKEKFPVLSYEEAMRSFGSDKPDLRNPLRLKPVSQEIFSKIFPKIPLNKAGGPSHGGPRRPERASRGPSDSGPHHGKLSDSSQSSGCNPAPGDSSSAGKNRGGDIAKALFIPFLQEVSGPSDNGPVSNKASSGGGDRGEGSAGAFCASRLSKSRLKKLNEEAKKAGCRGLLWIAAEGRNSGRDSLLAKEAAPEDKAALLFESGLAGGGASSETELASIERSAETALASQAGPGAQTSRAAIPKDADADAQTGRGGDPTPPGPGSGAKQAEKGLCLIGFGEEDSVNRFMSSLISRFGKEAGLIKSGFAFVWISDFPFWERDSFQKQSARHHPFTSPDREGIKRLMETDGDFSDDCSIKARAYDLVCNGRELAGGSVRNHSSAVQKKIFSLSGLSDEEISCKFGFFLKALSLGAPPHAGIAFGLDRLLMLLAGTENIRDVAAFPKSASGSCLMSGAPSPVDPALLKDLNLSSSTD